VERVTVPGSTASNIRHWRATFIVSGQGPVAGSRLHINEPSISTKDGEFLD
jgi:hypothetical protein